MKFLRATGVRVVEGFESSRNTHKRNKKKAVMPGVLILTLLFAFSVSLTSYASDGTELIKAAGKGDLSRVNKLIDKGADGNSPDGRRPNRSMPWRFIRGFFYG